jgi:hypothetical protein
LIGRNTLNPQCPADRSAASGLREAFRSEMQVCPSTQLPLPYVRNEAVGRPHQPQQLSFVGFLSAAQAGADRLAHISSLIASGTSSGIVAVCFVASHLKTAGEVARGSVPRVSHLKTADDMGYRVGK